MDAEGPDRRYGVLGASPGMRAWGDAHPARMAALQGILFGILFGVFSALVLARGSFWWNVAVAVFAAVLFALAMWAVATVRRRRTDRA